MWDILYIVKLRRNRFRYTKTINNFSAHIICEEYFSYHVWNNNSHAKSICLSLNECTTGPSQKKTPNISVYDEISKIAHFGSQNSKHFFGEHTFPTRFFRSVLTPRTISNLWTRNNKNVFSQNPIFYILFFLLPFLNSTQFEFGRLQNEFKCCTPLIMVSLASSTLTVPILILKWGQNMTKEWQNLHISKYLHFHPLFLAIFLHFFSITCCTWIFYRS